MISSVSPIDFDWDDNFEGVFGSVAVEIYWVPCTQLKFILQYDESALHCTACRCGPTTYADVERFASEGRGDKLGGEIKF